MEDDLNLVFGAGGRNGDVGTSTDGTQQGCPAPFFYSHIVIWAVGPPLKVKSGKFHFYDLASRHGYEVDFVEVVGVVVGESGGAPDTGDQLIYISTWMDCIKIVPS